MTRSYCCGEFSFSTRRDRDVGLSIVMMKQGLRGRGWSVGDLDPHHTTPYRRRRRKKEVKRPKQTARASRRHEETTGNARTVTDTPFTTAAASRGGAEGPLVLPHRKAWSSPMRLNSPPRGPHPTTTVVLPRPAEGRPSRQGAAVGLVQNAFAGDTTLCFLLWLVYVYTNRSFSHMHKKKWYC